jgi:hypothetical protein
MNNDEIIAELKVKNRFPRMTEKWLNEALDKARADVSKLCPRHARPLTLCSQCNSESMTRAVNEKIKETLSEKKEQVRNAKLAIDRIMHFVDADKDYFVLRVSEIFNEIFSDVMEKPKASKKKE